MEHVSNRVTPTRRDTDAADRLPVAIASNRHSIDHVDSEPAIEDTLEQLRAARVPDTSDG